MHTGERRVGGHPLAPGDFLLDAAILASIGLMLLNDIYLKSAHPGLLSWKLSDFAGLAFFPALLVAVAEIAVSVVGRRQVLGSRAWFWISAAITAVSFTLIKLVPDTGAMTGRVIDSLLVGLGLDRTPTAFVPDVSDLLALPATLIAVWVGYRWRD